MRYLHISIALVPGPEGKLVLPRKGITYRRPQAKPAYVAPGSKARLTSRQRKWLGVNRSQA